MDYLTLTADQKLNILRDRLRADEASHFSSVVDDQANGTEHNTGNIETLEKRIAFYKEEIAKLEKAG